MGNAKMALREAGSDGVQTGLPRNEGRAVIGDGTPFDAQPAAWGSRGGVRPQN